MATVCRHNETSAWEDQPSPNTSLRQCTQSLAMLIILAIKKADYKIGFLIWSGKRDSNSRPRPWQGRALPTELFPLGLIS
jgi:hypothetical protein